ncbi:MAG: cytochrome c [Paracoccaceae bacterium]|nr:cytochrome c [Paracoccaceae bacterium]
MKLAIALVMLVAGPAGADESSPAALAMGKALYASNCASCHGVNLEGQPNWRRRLPTGRMPAPPHDATGHTWHHSDEDLFRMVKLGVAAVVGHGYESDMPAFGSVLTDEQIRAILSYIKSRWPDRQRAGQAEVTRQAEGAAQ